MQPFGKLDLYMTILRNQAQYIMTAEHRQYTVILYSWKEFFIEQYYNNELDTTERIALAGDEEMQKFLKQIEISELF